MAALLVSLAVMAVLMSVALPVWRHEAQREKEAELVFRGQQYIRAIRLFQMKTGTLPTSVDLLVQGHYLRKKFKDPITNDDFDLVGPGGMPGQPGQPGLPGGPTPPGRGGSPTAQGGRGTTSGSGVGQAPTISSTSGTAPTGTIPGGMMGVRSKSKDESIRLYLGRNHYNEWVFLYAQGPAGGGRGQPGGGPQRGMPGGGGGRGGGPGRGGPPVIGPGRGRL
jgi:type II secretory pathway pseudopilin PulG